MCKLLGVRGPAPKDVYKLLGVRGPTPKDVYKLLGVRGPTPKDLWQADSMRDKKTMVGADGRARVHYLVHWTGYASEDDTWEPLSNLPQQGARQLVNTYNAKLRTAQRG